MLGDAAQWPNANACMTDHLTRLQQDGVVVPGLDPETAVRLITGASSQASQRIGNSKDPEATSKKVVAAFKQLLEGLHKGLTGRPGSLGSLAQAGQSPYQRPQDTRRPKFTRPATSCLARLPAIHAPLASASPIRKIDAWPL